MPIDNSDSTDPREPGRAFIESAGDFTHVRPGDLVYREFVGRVFPLRVTSIDDELIYTGDQLWQFDRRTGWETDEELGFGWRFGVTISRLIRSETPQHRSSEPPQGQGQP